MGYPVFLEMMHTPGFSSHNIIFIKKIFFFNAIALLFSFLSCNNRIDSPPQYIYFGGEIVNPSVDHIILKNNNAIYDTIYLDKNNRFLKKYESIPDGLYRFWHQPESQMIFLEKGDSVLVRLNTIEFDESLVFSGRGAEKNNFLIDMFLQNELERTLNDEDFKLSPEAFLKKKDSLKASRLKRFHKLLKKNKLSKLASKICKSTFMSHYYAQKEMYPYRHYDTNITDAKEKFDEFSNSFYDYRKTIDLNDDDLKNSYDYTRFLHKYIDNVSYMDFTRKNNYKEEEPNATISRLAIIDSVFHHEYIKNLQLHGITWQFMIFNEDSISSHKVLKNYLSKNTNKRLAKSVSNIVDANTKLEPGDIIPDQKLISSDTTTIHLSDLLKKNPLTAIYFWSILDIQYYKKAHAKVTELRKRHPEIQFIAINIDEDKTKKWINILDKYEYHPDYEYQFDDASKSRKELVLYIYSRDKTILLGEKGKILNPNANIFNDQFESELLIYAGRSAEQR